MPKRVMPADTVPWCQFYVHDTIPLDEVGNSLSRQLAMNRVIIHDVLYNAVLTELWAMRPRYLHDGKQRCS